MFYDLRSGLKRRLSPGMIALFRNTIHNVHSDVGRLLCRGHGLDDSFMARSVYRDIWRYSAINEGNNYYGIESALREYARRSDRIMAPIEHGVYFGSFVNRHEANPERYPCVITFSDVRRGHIQTLTDMPVLPIGPYIQYSPAFLKPTEWQNVKKATGRLLIVFPSHSIEATSVSYDVNALIRASELLAEKEAVDAVWFCLYFHDINKGMGEQYQKRGHVVVCAGHRSDPMFLPRLRSMLELADVTASNSVGTHIGYSEALGTPHMMIGAKADETGERLVDLNGLTPLGQSSEREKNEVWEAFASANPEARLRVLGNFWGHGTRLAPDSMAAALKAIEDAYRLMWRSGIEAGQAMRLILGECPDEVCRLFSMPQDWRV